MEVGPEISLDTVLGITNFYEFDPPIPKDSLKNNIDKTPYK